MIYRVEGMGMSPEKEADKADEASHFYGAPDNYLKRRGEHFLVLKGAAPSKSITESVDLLGEFLPCMAGRTR